MNGCSNPMLLLAEGRRWYKQAKEYFVNRHGTSVGIPFDDLGLVVSGSHKSGRALRPNFSSIRLSISVAIQTTAITSPATSAAGAEIKASTPLPRICDPWSFLSKPAPADLRSVVLSLNHLLPSYLGDPVGTGQVL